MRKIILLFYFLTGTICFSFSSIVPVELRCESLKDPDGIDVLEPRLSWIGAAADSKKRGIRQTACQIMVATSKNFSMQKNLICGTAAE